jgi:F-type H+-transporting ATPase subunit b
MMVLPLGLAENSIQLVPDGTIIFHVLLILVMVYVLNATLFKPINQILAAREKRTRGRLTEAQEIMGSVSEKLAEYERALRAAKTESYAFTEHERAGAMQIRQQQLDETRAQIATSTKAEKENIQRQAQQAQSTLEDDARRIAVEIGSRVLSRPVHDSDLN